MLMIAQLRRFTVLIALMFWQGGFTFYAAVVVPIGQEELGSHESQGFITRGVTNYQNRAGAIAQSPKIPPSRTIVIISPPVTVATRFWKIFVLRRHRDYSGRRSRKR